MTNLERRAERSRFYNKVLVVFCFCLIALLAIVVASTSKKNRYADENISNLDYLSSGYGEYEAYGIRFCVYSYDAADDASALDMVDRVKPVLEKQVIRMKSDKIGMNMIFGIVHNKGKSENGIKSYMFGCGEGAKEVLEIAFPDYLQGNGPVAFTLLLSREFDIVPAIYDALEKQYK